MVGERWIEASASSGLPQFSDVSFTPYGGGPSILIPRFKRGKGGTRLSPKPKITRDQVQLFGFLTPLTTSLIFESLKKALTGGEI